MASNDYIKFDGVEGEATDANHGGWIEVQNWSHGFDQPSSPTRASQGSTIERANHGDLNFTKYLDSSTDSLLKACWSGKQFETVNMDCLKADGENTAIKFLEIKMEDVIVSNYGISGGGNGGIPMENISLSYSKVTYTYIQKNKEDGMAGGNKPVSHDLKNNTVE